MTRHLASKKAKQILTKHNVINIPIPITLGWIIFVLGIFTD